MTTTQPTFTAHDVALEVAWLEDNIPHAEAFARYVYDGEPLDADMAADLTASELIAGGKATPLGEAVLAVLAATEALL